MFYSTLVFELKKQFGRGRRRYVLLGVGIPVLYYLVFINVAPHGGTTPVEGTIWRNYLLVSMTAFGSVFMGVSTGGIRFATERMSGWLRQLRITPLMPWVYFLAKIAVALLEPLMLIVVLFVVSHIAVGTSLSFTQWMQEALALWVGVIPFIAFGFALGFLVNGQNAGAVQNLPIFIISYLGGLFQPIFTMPSIMRTIAYAMPTYNYANIAWGLLAGKSPEIENILVLVGYTLIFILIAVVLYRRDHSRAII
jgi:ABC-2 type transport system permease protein